MATIENELEHQSLTIVWDELYRVLHVFGELDLTTADSLRDAINVATSPGAKLSIDLAGIAFTDSTGLQPILEACVAARRDGGSIQIRNPSRIVRTVATAVPSVAEVLGAGEWG